MDNKPLNVLLVEDNEADAELVVRELRRSGFSPQWKRVQTEPDFSASLSAKIDIILSDYSMPQFDGIRALELLKKSHFDIPFIIVSGTIGEDIAVKAMQKGATDYLLKDRLARLSQAIEHALTEKRLREEQKQAEARLQLQEQQYRLLFEINPNSMWVFDTKTMSILAVNQAAIAQYGYTREEFLKLTIKDLRPAEDIPDLIKARAISSPLAMSHYSGQYRHKKKDGSVIVVEIYSSPVTWNKAAARIVSAIDITERKKADERLREQADIIDRAHDAVIIRDFESDKVTFWNSGAEHLYGLTKEEAIGRKLGELIFAESAEREALVKELVSVGEYHGEIKHRCKDGREVIVDTRTTLIRDNENRPRAVIGINSDVTEQKKLEMQLLRAQRLDSIGTLASGVAHDLNNVLAPILMSAEIGRSGSRPDAGSLFALIYESAKRGAAIVKQVLTFARGVEGERVLIKPTHLIDEMIDIARRTFPKSIEISSRYPDDLWSIKGDPTQLHQVLLNLCVNARDAMPAGGSLVIWAENVQMDDNYAAMVPGAVPGAYLSIRVTDTGVGIPRSVVEKIFDPFFTTKELGKGTGLGLSTTLGIVKSHSGFISVYSEPGKGTTFKIFLPVEVTEEIVLQPPTALETLSGHGEQILVVDDDATILRVTKMILESKGYRTLEAHDGPDALGVFAKEINAIDIVLTDMSLPFMDGPTLIRAMRKIKPEAKIIASTGQGGHAYSTQLAELGVKQTLNKPYDTQHLLEALRDALHSEK
jgi:PAS domain S-box-containing protein